MPHAEGEEGADGGAQGGVEVEEGSGGALEVSVALARCAVALARAHADAAGKTCRPQLIQMRASAGFVELARRAARLRTADVARLGDGARLAFWLNVYNALVRVRVMVTVTVRANPNPNPNSNPNPNPN